MGAGAGAGGRASSVSSRRSWAGIMQRFLKRVKEALACAESPARHPRCASAERSQLLCRAHRTVRIERLLTGECSERGREVVLQGMGVHAVAVVISLH